MGLKADKNTWMLRRTVPWSLIKVPLPLCCCPASWEPLWRMQSPRHCGIQECQDLARDSEPPEGRVMRISDKETKLVQARSVVPSPAFLPRWSYKSRNQDRNTPESLSKLWPTLARCRPYYSLWHFSCLLGLELVSSVFISLASEFSETDLNLLALVTETLTWGRILNWHSLGEICRSRKNKKLIPL